MKKILPLFFGITILLAGCSPKSTPAEKLAGYFQPLQPSDTLILSVDEPGDDLDTIPLTDFFAAVPDTLRQDIDYMMDTGETMITPHGRFPLDDRREALVADIVASWWLNKSLLVYDKQEKRVVAAIPVATFYGGEGGQVTLKSWLYPGADGQKRMVTRQSDHWMTLNEEDDDPQQHYAESVALFGWQNGMFREELVQDSAMLIRKFPIPRDF
ncbi:MAG TPA: hypothetical protein PKE06_11420 [Flavilitoribacter sp.]|nr:hypothetical protein [Flavilitoribacter sp.]HMQ87249.1 hypothetical protein [Flavilitoribacter sp.]